MSSSRARVACVIFLGAIGLIVAGLLLRTGWSMRPRANTRASADPYEAIADSYSFDDELTLVDSSETRSPTRVQVSRTWRYSGPGRVCEFLGESGTQNWLDDPAAPNVRGGLCGVDGNKNGTSVEFIDGDCSLMYGIKPGDKCLTLNVYGHPGNH